jgi:hypothetical protein
MMFSVIEHIEYLVTLHDCVVVPGWGAFIANYSASSYDAEAGMMSHPRRSIGFNASVSHNDGLLAQSLVRREGINYNEAMKFIADSVTTFRQQLAMDCEVSMGRLGYFRRNEGRFIEFVPFYHSDGTDQFFGLNDMEIKDVTALEKDMALADETAAAIVPKERNLFIRKATRIAASVAVLIGLGVVLTTPMILNRDHQNLASMAPAVSAPKAQQLNVTVEQGVSSQGISTVATQPRIASVGNDSGRYYMVIATLRNQQELDAFKNSNPSLVPYMKVLKYKKFMCVYVARSDDSNTLMGLRDELPEHLRDIWIYS